MSECQELMHRPYIIRQKKGQEMKHPCIEFITACN